MLRELITKLPGIMAYTRYSSSYFMNKTNDLNRQRGFEHIAIDIEAISVEVELDEREDNDNDNDMNELYR